MSELQPFYAELEQKPIEPPKSQTNEQEKNVLPFYQSAGEKEETTKPEGETSTQYWTRQALRTAEKVGVEAPLETIEGIGEISKSFSPLNWLLKTIGVSNQLTDEQIKELREKSQKYGIHIPGVSEPPITSKGVKRTLQKIAGQYFEPQSDLEDYFDQSFKTASQMLYGGEFTKGKLLRAGVGGFGGEATKRGTEKYVAGGVAPELAKAMTMMLASSFNWNGAKKLGNSYYSEAEAQNIKGIMGDARDFENELDSLIAKWEKGGETWADKKAIEQAKMIKSRINNGLLEYDEAWEAKKKLNDNARGLYSVKEPGSNAASIESAKGKFGEIRNATKNFMKKSTQTHPDWYSNIEKGDEIYEAIQNSKWVTNWIQKKLPFLKDDGLIHTLFGGLEVGLSKFSPLTGAAGVGVIATNKMIAIGKQMQKSPILRKYYTDLAKNALKQNAAGFVNAFNRFKKEYEKENKYTNDQKYSDVSSQKES